MKIDGMYTSAARAIAMGEENISEQIFATIKQQNVQIAGFKTKSDMGNVKVLRLRIHAQRIASNTKYEMLVAAAEPLMPKNFIKIGVRESLSKIATTEAKRVCFVLPEACSMPHATHEKLKNTLDGAMSARRDDKSDESKRRANISSPMAIKPAAHGSEITKESLKASEQSDFAFFMLPSLMFSARAGNTLDATAVAIETGRA